MSFGLDATSAATVWATIGLLLFVGILLYVGLPRMIGKLLDDRIKAIETELAEAEALRNEAKVLLESYAKKREAAGAEAAAIVTAAKEEAARLTAEAKEALEALVVRRTKAVEEKIALAETQALAEVRARSAEIAVEAARALLGKQMTHKGEALVERAIAEIGTKLN